MYGVRELSVVKLAAICLDNLAMSGLKVHELSPGPLLAPKLSEMGKSFIQPKLDPRFNDFTSETSFWLVLGTDKKNLCCVGARLEHLGAESPLEYWSRTIRRQYPSNGQVSFHHVDQAIVSSINGSVAYLGDLHFDKTFDDGDWKRDDVSRNFFLLLHLMIHLKWCVNCTYAFFRRGDVIEGQTELLHFTDSIPSFQKWKNAPIGRSQTEYLLMLPTNRFQHIVSYYSEHPEDLAWRP